MGRRKTSQFPEVEEEKTEYERQRDARVKLLHDSEEFRNVMQAIESL